MNGIYEFVERESLLRQIATHSDYILAKLKSTSCMADLYIHVAVLENKRRVLGPR